MNKFTQSYCFIQACSIMRNKWALLLAQGKMVYLGIIIDVVYRRSRIETRSGTWSWIREAADPQQTQYTSHQGHNLPALLLTAGPSHYYYLFLNSDSQRDDQMGLLSSFHVARVWRRKPLIPEWHFPCDKKEGREIAVGKAINSEHYITQIII